MRPKKRKSLVTGKGAATPPVPPKPLARPVVLPQLRSRILVLDIETLPIEAYVWGLFDQNIGLKQIKTEASIACFGAKWLGNDKMIFQDTGGRGADKVRDDSVLMPQLWDLLNQAEFVVAQNGQAFDVKWINGRLLIHGYKPPSPFRVIDTLLTARRSFRFTSNKLGWQSKYVTPDTQKSEHRKFPDFDLWLECLHDNPEAWKEMKHYNLQDVLACEQLYLKQRPWDRKHPNMGTYDWSLATACPTCGSTNVEAAGYRTLQANIYAQYRCNDCGAWSRGKEAMTDKETRRAKLVP